MLTVHTVDKGRVLCYITMILLESFLYLKKLGEIMKTMGFILMTVLALGGMAIGVIGNKIRRKLRHNTQRGRGGQG